MSERVQKRLKQLKEDAKRSGYILNSDEVFLKTLTEGLIMNDDRYGMETCPCRRFKGEKGDNLDIVCPCDYRDPDLAEYGACYCALYVSKPENSEKQIQVPERRPSLEERRKQKDSLSSEKPSALKYPVYRCKVCGYLCAADNPPRVCPICKSIGRAFRTVYVGIILFY